MLYPDWEHKEEILFCDRKAGSTIITKEGYLWVWIGACRNRASWSVNGTSVCSLGTYDGASDNDSNLVPVKKGDIVSFNVIFYSNDAVHGGASFVPFKR